MIKAFLSYAHKDEVLAKELNEHLGALKHEKIIETWWDQQISPGNNWSKEIAQKLGEADLILLLVSSAFLDSTYCYEKEMRHAIERHEAGTARVIPIILRPCHWQPAPFAQLQGLPQGMTPVTDCAENNRDSVWADVAKGIHRAVESFVAPHGGATSTPSPPSIAPTQATIGLTSILSVDEEELDSALDRLGSNWQEVSIKWPRSSDQLLHVIREAVKEFDEANIDSMGSKKFITEAPEAIGAAIRKRAFFQSRLAGLGARMNGVGGTKELDREYTREAVRNFLLLANFFCHWELAYLSSWEGLASLSLEAPSAWVPFQGSKSLDVLNRRVFGEQDLLRVRLYKIGPNSIEDLLGSLYEYVDVPGHFARASERMCIRPPLVFRGGLETCKWLIPQIEIRFGSLPETYAGDWEFSP